MRFEHHEDEVFTSRIPYFSMDDDETSSAIDIMKRAQASLDERTVIQFPKSPDVLHKHRRSV